MPKCQAELRAPCRANIIAPEEKTLEKMRKCSWPQLGRLYFEQYEIAYETNHDGSLYDAYHSIGTHNPYDRLSTSSADKRGSTLTTSSKPASPMAFDL
jgi:hypothetical protein